MTQILVVDDKEEVAEAVSLALRDVGHKTLVAHTLNEARAALDKHQIDGVIADVWMDTENGLDLGSALNKRTPPIPFAIMSGGGPGKSLESVTARADSLGAVAVLFKPFEDSELYAAVRAMMEDR